MVTFLVLIGKANRDTEFHQEPDHALCECQALFLTIVSQLGSSWSSERRSHARHKDLHYILETFFYAWGGDKVQTWFLILIYNDLPKHLQYKQTKEKWANSKLWPWREGMLTALIRTDPLGQPSWIWVGEAQTEGGNVFSNKTKVLVEL